MLFAHWSVPAADLRALLPAPLEPDTFQGDAWVGITPFRMRGLRLRGTPPIPFFAEFPEEDVRTYVRYRDRPGVYYFSLNAPNSLVVAGARAWYRMRYRLARVRGERGESNFHMCMERPSPQAAELEVEYRPSGDVFYPEPGTLDEWLIERWVLYTVDSRWRVRQVEIDRAPWPVQPAEGEFHRNTPAAASGITLPEEAPVLHFSRGVKVHIGPPRPADQTITGQDRAE